MADVDWSQFIRPGAAPFGWTPPPSKTLGEIYAAYGDTGAMSGETEGLSPAMRQMIRRGLGRRLSEQTMAERQQTAEQAMRGAAYVAPNPLAAAAATGLTSQFMGDSSQETTARVASSLIPAAGGRLLQAGMQYAPMLTMAGLTAGASMLPTATQTVAADTNPNPYKWDEAAAAQRRKAAERTANGMPSRAGAKYLTEFQAQESQQRSETMKNAADWEASNKGKMDAANALEGFKKSIEPAARVLKPEIQNQIQNATSIDAASRIYNDSMNEYTQANRTFAERDPELMHVIQLGTAGLGALGAGRLAAGRANRLAQATREADAAHQAAYGPGVSETTQGALNDLAKKQGTLARLEKLSPYDARELAVGTALPWVTGTGIPSAIDIAESAPGSERNTKAWGSLADPWNMVRGGVEGFGGTVLGQFGGGLRRDFGGTKAAAEAMLETIRKTPSVAPGTVVHSGPQPSSPPPGAAPMPANPQAPGAPAPPVPVRPWETPMLYPYLSGAAARGSYAKAVREGKIEPPEGWRPPGMPRSRERKSGGATKQEPSDENGPPGPDEIARAAVNPRMYNPPATEFRPFEADYPKGFKADEQGRLLTDVGGKPLNPDARWTVGRRVVGGEDQGFPHSGPEYDALATALIRQPAQVVEPALLPKRAGTAVSGTTTVDPVRGPTAIRLNSGLSHEDMLKVYGHELGHVPDEIAGQISSKGLIGELKTVYNDLNNHWLAAERQRNPKVDPKSRPLLNSFTPETNGYKGSDVEREYIAEAIRAYMRDPTYMKNVAPKTAAAIRAAVNSNPNLSQHIQFNSLPLAGGIGAAAAAPGLLNSPAEQQQW